MSYTDEIISEQNILKKSLTLKNPTIIQMYLWPSNNSSYELCALHLHPSKLKYIGVLDKQFVARH